MSLHKQKGFLFASYGGTVKDKIDLESYKRKKQIPNFRRMVFSKREKCFSII